VKKAFPRHTGSFIRKIRRPLLHGVLLILILGPPHILRCLMTRAWQCVEDMAVTIPSSMVSATVPSNVHRDCRSSQLEPDRKTTAYANNTVQEWCLYILVFFSLQSQQGNISHAQETDRACRAPHFGGQQACTTSGCPRFATAGSRYCSECSIEYVQLTVCQFPKHVAHLKGALCLLVVRCSSEISAPADDILGTLRNRQTNA
jgi:hypothetical protein